MGTRSEEAFARIVERYLGQPDVTAGTGFGGSPGLRVGGRIFAMLFRDELVVKLPRDRAEALVSSGSGVPFDPGHGRLMREWVSVPVAREDDWPDLVAEAFAYLASGTKRG
jgi:hypothetical protein